MCFTKEDFPLAKEDFTNRRFWYIRRFIIDTLMTHVIFDAVKLFLFNE